MPTRLTAVIREKDNKSILFLTKLANLCQDATDTVVHRGHHGRKVAVRFDEYDPSRPFLPWALWIAKIKIAEFYRSRQRRQVLLMGESMDALADACVKVQETLSDKQFAIDKCLDRLTDRAREMLNLRYSEGMSSPEIGNRLGMSVQYVRVALTRIRTALTECAQAAVGNTPALPESDS